MQWTPMPLLRAAGVLAAGIAAGSSDAPRGDWISGAALVVFFLLICRFSRLFFEGNPNATLVRGMSGLLAICALGWTAGNVRQLSNRKDHLSSAGSVRAYSVQIVSIPVATRYGITARARVIRMYDGNQFRTASGIILVSFDTLPPPFGATIWISGHPEAIHPPVNPHVFDRKDFYRRQGIAHEHRLRRADWMEAGRPAYGIIHLAVACRTWSLRQLTTYLPDRRERAIVAALVLGATEELDADVRADYTSTGVIHVLAVSGLHVGILYGLLLLFLPKVRGRNPGSWITLTISLAVLWVYACITGLSPSVLRAVVMFTIAALAWPLHKKSNMLNTLGASAFVLLLMDPTLLWSVGFQLSYAAVLGIVLYYPRFQKLLHPEAAVARWAWSMVCVSLAAQLLTVPLTLYYFHQFPVYFLPANLLAVPAGFVLLCGGLFLLAVSWWSWLAGWTGWLLMKVVWGLNASLSLLHMLPGSVMEQIPLSLTQCVLLYAGVALVTALFIVRRFFVVWMLALWASCYTWEMWQLSLDERRGGFVVYHIRGHMAVEWFSGVNSVVYLYPDIPDSSSLVVRQILPLRLARGVRHTRKLDASRSGPMSVHWHGHRFLLATGPFQSDTSADVTIVTSDAMAVLDTMKVGPDFGTLILATGGRSAHKHWARHPFSVVSQGAYYKQW